jgi:hypothetical protein
MCTEAHQRQEPTGAGTGSRTARQSRQHDPAIANFEIGANRPPSEGVECRLGSSIIKTASPKKSPTLSSPPRAGLVRPSAARSTTHWPAAALARFRAATSESAMLAACDPQNPALEPHWHCDATEHGRLSPSRSLASEFWFHLQLNNKPIFLKRSRTSGQVDLLRGVTRREANAT